MNMMLGQTGRAMDPTVKPMVQSTKTGKVFVVLKSYDDMVSGDRYVFIARPRHLNDMRRIRREKFDRLFRGFNEPLTVADGRVAFTEQDFQDALFEEGDEKPQETPQAPDTTVTGDASTPTQGVTPPATPKKRGRPKGAKNKKTLEREAAEAAAQAEKDRIAAAQAAGILPKDENETQLQQQTADTTVNHRSG